jgi:hypothetical protein
MIASIWCFRRYQHQQPHNLAAQDTLIPSCSSWSVIDIFWGLNYKKKIYRISRLRICWEREWMTISRCSCSCSTCCRRAAYSASERESEIHHASIIKHAYAIILTLFGNWRLAQCKRRSLAERTADMQLFLVTDGSHGQANEPGCRNKNNAWKLPQACSMIHQP